MSDTRIKYLQTPNLPKTPIGGGDGLTAEAKQALLACFENVAWQGTDGQDYYEALETALLYSADLVSISAVFTQGSATIYDTDALDTLKQYLVVTATYSDQTTRTISSYTLSGNLEAGSSIITVSYEDKTTTFTVTVAEASGDLIYNSPLVMVGLKNTETWDVTNQSGTIGYFSGGYPGLIPHGLLYKYADVVNRTIRFGCTVTASGVASASSGTGLIVQICLFKSANPSSIVDGTSVVSTRYDVLVTTQNGTFTPSVKAKVSDLVETSDGDGYLGFIICLNRDAGSIAVSNVVAEVI